MTDPGGADGARPGAVEPYLRGVPFPAVAGVAYPRADPADTRRLPADTWAAARVPAGVRLEMTGDARTLDVSYTCASDQLGYRGKGAGVTFSVWRDGDHVDEQPASVGAGVVRLDLGRGPGRVVIYLPEGMEPRITGLAAPHGTVTPAPDQPRWIAYGDSITEGWSAGAPALGWVARVGRALGLDAFNMGYAGSARGEIPIAEQIAGLEAHVVSVAFGTNCWGMIPHSVAMMRSVMAAFLDIVRAGHPAAPVVVVSPLVRPDAEDRPNRLGADLAGLRDVIEDAVRDRADPAMVLVPGRDLVPAHLLDDGVHPGDDGHALLADAVGAAVSRARAEPT